VRQRAQSHKGGTLIGTARCAAFRSRDGRRQDARNLLAIEHKFDILELGRMSTHAVNITTPAATSATTTAAVRPRPTPPRLKPACGVPEVGPGSLTSGDRWSDMIPECRCGCSI
jgi:hypothetical protein